MAVLHAQRSDLLRPTLVDVVETLTRGTVTMPCNTMQRSTIQWGEQTDVVALAQAMQELGYAIMPISRVQSSKGFRFKHVNTNVQGTFENGRMEIQGRVDQNTLKRAYSTEIVRAGLQRFGWQVKKTEDRFEAQRRF
jgi:hypothetical protein